MTTRKLLLILGTLLVVGVVVGGAGMALAWGHNGGAPWNGTSAGSNTGQYGYGPMMGPNGRGPMMGSNGHGPMMNGGYGAASPVTGVTQVSITGFAFRPANIQVSAGTTVTWTNLDTAPHSVVFTNGMKDSGELQTGQTFNYTFSTPGVYTYYCDVHPYMMARVTVTS